MRAIRTLKGYDHKGAASVKCQCWSRTRGYQPDGWDGVGRQSQSRVKRGHLWEGAASQEYQQVDLQPLTWVSTCNTQTAQLHRTS